LHRLPEVFDAFEVVKPLQCESAFFYKEVNRAPRLITNVTDCPFAFVSQNIKRISPYLKITLARQFTDTLFT
jgi:hypothetical protein